MTAPSDGSGGMMTPEREAEILALASDLRGFIVEFACAREELERLRSLLSDPPTCSRCDRLATREDVNGDPVCDDNEHGAYLSLDPSHPEGPNPAYDLPYAAIIRRLKP